MKKSNNTIDDVQKISIARSVRRRLPWLVVGLTGGLAAAGIISSFEETLSQNLFLAAFIPLIVYMSDAVGTQMESFAIRDFALHKHLKFRKYFFRQFLVVLIIGVILSLVLYAYTLITKQDTIIAAILAMSLFLAILSSIITGLLIPFLFNKTRLDPANASGPVATIVQDLLSVTIYFVIAHFLLSS